MNFEYTEKITDLIQLAEQTNVEAIKTCAQKFAECVENDKVIHAFGTGHSHMVGVEMFCRAGGLGNVNAMVDPDAVTTFGTQRSGAMERVSGVADVIYDSYKIEKGDIMVITSNSGRNAVPIEMAMRCRKEGIYTIAITNVKQSSNQTSRHSSGKRLFELCDCVIDTCVPTGDATMDIKGIKTGPASNIIGMFLGNSICAEAIRILADKEIKPYVFQSQNIDGFSNDAIYEHFDGRVKHF